VKLSVLFVSTDMLKKLVGYINRITSQNLSPFHLFTFLRYNLGSGELVPWRYSGKDVQFPQVCHQIAVCTFASQVWLSVISSHDMYYFHFCYICMILFVFLYLYIYFIWLAIIIIIMKYSTYLETNKVKWITVTFVANEGRQHS